MTRLSDEELRDVLARAEEIQRGVRHGREWDAEVAAVVSAAEEVGIPRAAVERALKERLGLPAPPEVGQLAWAHSIDGKFYVAEVVELSADVARVRFLGGGEQLVPLDQVRACAFTPGERVVCNWPWWGRWTCSVVSYDPIKRRVKLDDGWGYRRTFPISEVWLAPAKTERSQARWRVYVTLIGAGAAAGAVIGSLVTALLLR